MKSRHLLTVGMIALIATICARSGAADGPSAPAPPATAPSQRPQPPAARQSPTQALFDTMRRAAPAAPPPPATAPRPPLPPAPRKSLIQSLSDAIRGALGPEARNEEAQRFDPNVRNQAAQRAAEDANIRNFETQFRPQFQQLLYAELAFLRRACKPDPNAFTAVAAASKARLRRTVHENAVAMWARMRQPNRSNTGGLDARAEVQQLVASLAEANLGPAEAVCYLAECDKRGQCHKHAVVLNLVAALDERLVLSAEQRAKLVHSLAENYETAWDYYVQQFAFSLSYLPSIRDDSIVPLLNEKQASVWRQLAKQTGNVFWGVPMFRFGTPGEVAEIQEISRLVQEGPDEPQTQ
jgi:hypothetical protein